MKELIDIPEESYNFAKECKSKGSSKYDWGLTHNNTVFMIANGKALSDMTNGDIFTTIFSDLQIEDNGGLIYVHYPDGGRMTFIRDWWNSPYRG